MAKWNLKYFWNIWTSWISCQKIKLVPKWQIMSCWVLGVTGDWISLMGREENKLYLMVREWFRGMGRVILGRTFFLLILGTAHSTGPRTSTTPIDEISGHGSPNIIWNLYVGQIIFNIPFLDREEHVTTSNNSTLQRVLTERPSSAKRSKKDTPKGWNLRLD